MPHKREREDLGRESQTRFLRLENSINSGILSPAQKWQQKPFMCLTKLASVDAEYTGGPGTKRASSSSATTKKNKKKTRQNQFSNVSVFDWCCCSFARSPEYRSSAKSLFFFSSVFGIITENCFSFSLSISMAFVTCALCAYVFFFVFYVLFSFSLSLYSLSLHRVVSVWFAWSRLTRRTVEYLLRVCAHRAIIYYFRSAVCVLACVCAPALVVVRAEWCWCCLFLGH